MSELTYGEQLILGNLQDIFKEVKKLTDKQNVVIPVLPGTGNSTPPAPKPEVKDPVAHWKSFFTAPVSTRVDVVGWGFVMTDLHFNTKVLAWHFEGLEDGPEIFGEKADMRVLHRSEYKMFLDVLFAGCGDRWWDKVFSPDDTGLADSGLGIPGTWPCPYRTRNGLK